MSDNWLGPLGLFFRDGETTIKIQFCVLEGGWSWGQREQLSKDAVSFEKHHNNRILKVYILLSRNVVVFAQALSFCQVFLGQKYFGDSRYIT